MQFSLLEFALVKKIFKPRQCSAAPDWEFMVIQFALREMEMFLLCDDCFCSFCANDQLCLYRKWLL